MKTYTYNRYLWLVNTLLRCKRVTFKELQYKWECSTLYEGEALNLRTFHLHRDAVQKIFQITINCDVNDGYKYYIEDSLNLSRDKSRQWLLNSFNVADIVQQSHTLQNRILLEDIPCGSEYLPVVIEAMQKNKELEISYMPFYRDEPETLHLQPYCMKVHRQRWYIAGHMRERDDIRQIALDRTLSMTLTNTCFKMPKDFFPEDYYSRHVGIWVNENSQPERLILRAYGQQSQYLQKLPLHHTQKAINETPKFTDYQYRMGITHELIYELLGMADSIEVLEPLSLRKEMLRTVQNITHRYRHVNQKFPGYK